MKGFNHFVLYLACSAILVRTILIYGIGAISPDYNPSINFISELAAEGTAYQTLMNAGMLYFGCSVFLLSFVFRSVLEGPGIRWIATLTAINGIGCILVGLLPCSPGCQMDVYPLQMKGHMAAAFFATFSAILAVLVFAFGFFRRIPPIRLRLTSLALGIIGIASFLLLWIFIVVYLQGTILDYANYRGLLQRIHVSAGDLWLLMICFWILFGIKRGNYKIEG
jgi:hypothetical protein